MPFASVNDTTLYYESHGDKDPLVLITGFNQNSLCYAPFLEELVPYFRVILFDNRGTGQSDVPEGPYTIEMLTEDTAALLDHLKISSAHFLGTSMGTLVAQKLCIDHPDRVKRAILCAPFAKLPNLAIHNIRTQLKLLTKGVAPIDLMELNAAWLLSNDFLSSQQNVNRFLKYIASNPYPTSPQGTIAQAQLLFDTDLREEIDKIPHELLLLVGERDIDTPPYCAEEIESRARNCTTHIFKGMGHMFNYEHPKATCKQVVRFLSS